MGSNHLPLRASRLQLDRASNALNTLRSLSPVTLLSTAQPVKLFPDFFIPAPKRLEATWLSRVASSLASLLGAVNRDLRACLIIEAGEAIALVS